MWDTNYWDVFAPSHGHLAPASSLDEAVCCSSNYIWQRIRSKYSRPNLASPMPPFTLVTVTSSTCGKDITTAGFRAHNHISSSTTQEAANNSHMTRKPNAHQFLLYAEMVCVSLAWCMHGGGHGSCGPVGSAVIARHISIFYYTICIVMW